MSERDDEPNARAPATAASAQLGVNDAREQARADVRVERARAVSIAALAGVACLLVCIALIVGACVSSSSRGSRPQRAFTTFLSYQAEYDCGHVPHRGEPDRCGEAAGALVTAWREAQAPVSLLENAGAALARSVGIHGFGEPVSSDFVAELDGKVRAWPLARQRAALPVLGALAPRTSLDDGDARVDARVQLRTVHPRTIVGGHGELSLVKAALADAELRDDALAFALAAHLDCTEQLLNAARVPTTPVQGQPPVLRVAMTCLRALDAILPDVHAAVRARPRVAGDRSHTRARALWSASMGTDLNEAIATWTSHDVRWSMEPVRMVRRGAAHASAEERRRAAERMRVTPHGSIDDTMRARAVAVALAGVDDVGRAACDRLLADAIADPTTTASMLRGVLTLGCAMPTDLVERTRTERGVERIANAHHADCNNPLAILYGAQLRTIEVTPANIDARARIFAAQRALDVHEGCVASGLAPLVGSSTQTASLLEGLSPPERAEMRARLLNER